MLLTSTAVAVIIFIVVFLVSGSVIAYMLLGSKKNSEEVNESTENEQTTGDTHDVTTDALTATPSASSSTPAAQTNSSNMTRFIKTFKQSHETTADCCGGNGGGPHELICPSGSFVTDFHGNASWVVNNLGLKCSDDKKTHWGAMGGNGFGGTSFSVSSASGFRRLGVRTGSQVDKIQFYDDNNALKLAVGGDGGKPYDLDCGKDAKIVGLKLRTGAMVDRIQLVCGKYHYQ